MRSPSPPSIVTVAILTTITIIFWVFFGVYRVLVSESDVNIPPEILESINPTLDQNALGQLENRLFFEKGETVEFKAIISKPTDTITPEPTEIPEEVEEASPEADLESQ